jgi:hypothetical protein
MFPPIQNVVINVSGLSDKYSSGSEAANWRKNPGERKRSPPSPSSNADDTPLCPSLERFLTGGYVGNTEAKYYPSIYYFLVTCHFRVMHYRVV